MSRRRALAVTGGVVAVLAAAYVGGYVLTGQRLPADTTIAGVDVGGKSPDDAEAELTRGLAERVEEPIVATFEEQKFELDPEQAGLAVDVPASIRAAGGRSWDPRDMVALFVGGSDHDPRLTVDETKLAAAVASIAETVDQPVVQAQITFPDAKPKARQPKPGNQVPQEELAQTIRESWLTTDEPLRVPVASVAPAVDRAGLQKAMREIAQPAVSGPVTLKVGSSRADLPVTAYAPALSVVVRDGRMVPTIDAKDLAGPLTSSVTGIGRRAVDASFRFEGGKPVVVPSKAGIGLDPQTMAEQLVPVLTKAGDQRSITVEATAVQPDFTTKDAEALGIKERIGSYTTQYPHADYRNTNQAEAARRINGTILQPGETFSFNEIVGERTAANGFVSGFVINGGVFREELGGGVSQVATTAYNAAFFAGLDDVEHHPHAFYIDRYPVGREATIYYGSLDLRFRNPYKTGVVIRAWVDKSGPGSSGRMNVEMYGTKVYEVKSRQSERYNFREPRTQYDDTPACVSQAPVTGFDIDIHRDFYQGGKRVKTEKDTAYYQAADRVICGKKPQGD
ncbi:VanW family protein [Aeromicrobium duanguangcaii]|uniref:VanW family protein n=1 Tax=Aeromicrobium duanguangcaii TaxID=2968086 RepID=A0ABY5KFM7_9ACTN|nr:VanW family protein [Aeromicrobium duanguangcaii]MCD9153646.1 VanW family protein [Aeromicrobium duanguangcaii]UUI69271.1 VanW family protein [Aeromicrobium duanguangcaii]